MIFGDFLQRGGTFFFVAGLKWLDRQNWDLIRRNLNKKHVFISLYGCFLKWWYPENTPKWSFLVGKPMVVGYQRRNSYDFFKGVVGWVSSFEETSLRCILQDEFFPRKLKTHPLEHNPLSQLWKTSLYSLFVKVSKGVLKLSTTLDPCVTRHLLMKAGLNGWFLLEASSVVFLAFAGVKEIEIRRKKL